MSTTTASSSVDVVAKTGDAPSIAVVVPVHNEEENIIPLVDEIVSALRGNETFEILYVDDGSKDTSLQVLIDYAKKVPELRVLKHLSCCGQSMAVWTGVKHARAAVVATLDGDGQNDPADIPNMLAAYRDQGGGDRILIAGHRTKRQDSKVKKISSKVGNGVRQALLGDNTPDTGCGLKVFSREAFLTFPRFDHMHRFMPALMIRLGGTVTSVKVNHRPRERGTSKYGVWNRLWVSLADLVGVIWLQSRGSKPEAVEQTPAAPDGPHDGKTGG